jgi:peptidoglycan hydrolase CwlO-like protein
MTRETVDGSGDFTQPVTGGPGATSAECADLQQQLSGAMQELAALQSKLKSELANPPSPEKTEMINAIQAQINSFEAQIKSLQQQIVALGCG